MRSQICTAGRQMQQVGTTGKESPKNMPKRGRSPNHEEPGASKKNKSNQRNAPKQQRSRSKSIPANNSGAKKQTKPRKPGTSRRKKQRFQAKKYKQTSVAVTKQINSESAQLFWQEKTTKEATATKLIAQFGFVGDPTISKRHNAAITLAKMPTWYYFSRPSNMAFHDFTKRHRPQKNLRSLLGLGLKFIPTPSLTNCWSRLKQSSYDRLFRSVHLRFHFDGKPPAKVQPLMIQKSTSIRHGHHHTGPYPLTKVWILQGICPLKDEWVFGCSLKTRLADQTKDSTTEVVMVK